MRRSFFLVLLFGISYLAIGQQAERYIIKDNYLQLTPDGVEYYTYSLPSIVDNSDEIYFPPIYDQEHWVCNQVAASFYTFTYEFNRVRNFSSQNPYNLFSVYFPWNWLNSGYGWWGSHWSITFDILKTVGMPTLYNSPADLQTDSSIWMSGYDKYYDAMKHRIKDYHIINTSTPEGLMMLKGWIYDHGRDEFPGGLAVFLSNIAQYGGGDLPSGSAESGSYVIHTCSNDPSHSRTIVGYNDNICWDYNGDGNYTNNIDLNNDGIIDVRDWEKGGFKLAEGFGDDWHQNGFCYIMYKCFADRLGEGGILNHDVGIIEPALNYEPMITARVRLKYEDRDNIKISFGINPDTSSLSPLYELDFPIMNYSEGDHFYMQGGNTEEDKTIELGFDISPLLNYISPNDSAAFYIIIREYDYQYSYELDIQDFTILTYDTNIAVEHQYTGEYNIIDNGTTKQKMILSVNYNKPEIITNYIPVINTNQNFAFQMQSAGGDAPIEWDLLPAFTKEKITQTYNSLSDEYKITPNEYFDGLIKIDLPFDFPFSDTIIKSVKVHSNGFVLLDTNTNQWYYTRSYMLDCFLNEPMIAPNIRHDFVCDIDEGDGIWYKSSPEKASIRWQCSQQWSEPWSRANFGLDLYPDGTIEFIYGSNDYNIFKRATSLAGVSLGDNKNYFISDKNEMTGKDTCVRIVLFPLPEHLSISTNGVLSGNIDQELPYPINISIKDSQFLTDIKQYEIHTGINKTVNSDFIVYPIPSSKTVNIKFNTPTTKNTYIYITSILGDKILQIPIKSGSNSTSIGISNLPTGVYLIVWENEEQARVRKLVIER